MSPVFDVVVVGAGPYGLSTAAHLLGRGLRVAVFGRTLEMWREHMPKGMLLRSHWWATNLSDPRRDYGFEQFARDSGHSRGYPLPIQTFIDYGLWFQQRAVPDVDETYVASIERQDGRFLITLEDGREVESRAVVMAIGVSYYANRPEQFTGLPADLVSHSSEHRDFARFKGRDVVVIGGGQSAIEYAALLHEAGAAVQVVSRRPIQWLRPDRWNTRNTLERILAPDASIAPGWHNWVLDHMPYLFYRFPRERKDAYNAKYYSGATDWLRNRVIGKVTLREGHTVANVKASDGRVAATLSDGARLSADHILLATGYGVDINKLTMIHPSLRAEIETNRAIPGLSHWFESSVPGLYFVGLTSMRAFGPLYRFVAGCGAAARRVADGVVQARSRRSRALPMRDGAATVRTESPAGQYD
ncbi:MAG TPA: NAD(P)-binding domain-containing protein [Gemmatimonadales bacterium]|nr:NAD(P)-binding domain-containing protein [Gemmatimonadales bacterium]